MPFVIWNVDEQKYVALPGSKSSFTKYLQHARTFKSEREAQSDCCGNEFPRAVEREMGFRN